MSSTSMSVKQQAPTSWPVDAAAPSNNINRLAACLWHITVAHIGGFYRPGHCHFRGAASIPSNTVLCCCNNPCTARCIREDSPQSALACSNKHHRPVSPNMQLKPHQPSQPDLVVHMCIHHNGRHVQYCIACTLAKRAASEVTLHKARMLATQKRQSHPISTSR
jgi:hypothetical protein